MDKLVAGFGEVMLRLSPGGKKRFSQALPGVLEATLAERRRMSVPRWRCWAANRVI